MKGINYLFVLLLISGNLCATNYTFTGDIDTEWANSGNWDVYPGLILAEGDTAFIESPCMLMAEIYEINGDVIVQADASLSMCSDVTVFGKITNYGSIMSDGFVNIDETGVIQNDGTITGFGYFLYGQIINNGEAIDLSIDGEYGGEIINYGIMNNFSLQDPGGVTFHNTESGIVVLEYADISGEFINDGEITGTSIFNHGGSIVNNGNMELADIYGYIGYEGGISLVNNGTISTAFLENLDGSDMLNTGVIEVSELLAVWEYSSLDNSGTINTFHFFSYGIVTNSGDFTITEQGDNGYDDYENPGTSYIVNDGFFHTLGDFYNNDTIYNNLDFMVDGMLYGDGIVIGNIIIESSIAPGNSPGIFSVNGDYEQTATSNLIIELDGPSTGTPGVDFDQVDVTGQATLAGTLTVQLNTTEPNVGDSYPIMNYGSLKPGSEFALDLPVLSGDKVWTVIYNSDGVLLIVDAALPVEMSKFSVSDKGTSIQLNWTTETEVNNAGFEVLRSATSDTWEVISFVGGHGTTLDQKEYKFNDEKPLEGKSYYRLNQIDNNGRYSLSQILVVDRERRVNVFPNPVSNYLMVNSPNRERFSVVNQSGILVNEGIVEGFQRIDLSVLPEGNYMFILGNETIQLTKRN